MAYPNDPFGLRSSRKAQYTFTSLLVAIPRSRILKSIYGISLPSPRSLQKVFVRSHSNHGPRKPLHPTAYLDGLRGLAAFFVFNHHWMVDWHHNLQNGYGTSASDYSLLQLPIVRIFYSGSGMVAAFFVISGYALSYKAVAQIHAQDSAGVLNTLSSAVFRRAIRLFLPIIVSTFISMLIIRGDWYTSNHDAHLIPNRSPTFTEQFADWWKHICKSSNPFAHIDIWNLYGNPYDGHTWTIPIEYRGSIVVYIMLLALAKARPITRFAITLYFLWFTLYLTKWDTFLFLSGMLLADINRCISTGIELPFPVRDRITNSSYYSHIRNPAAFTKRHKTAFLHSTTIPLFVLSTHLLSWPDDHANHTYGYKTLARLAPSNFTSMAAGQPSSHNAIERFWVAIGAVLLVTSLSFSPISTSKTDTYRLLAPSSPTNPSPLPNVEKPPVQASKIPFLQRPFTTTPVQYLGKISYSFYLMHGPILFSFGDWMRLGSLNFLHLSGLTWSFVCWAVDFAVVLAAAVMFERWVDRSAVEVGKWVGSWCWIV